MNDIRKLLDIINETTAGATASGGVAPVSQSMHTQRRVEEDYSEESSDKPQMPQILEYGNWENSALTTSKKLKKSRKKASKIVKSVYGEDMPGEKKEVTEGSQLARTARKIIPGLGRMQAKMRADHEREQGRLAMRELPGRERKETEPDDEYWSTRAMGNRHYDRAKKFDKIASGVDENVAEGVSAQDKNISVGDYVQTAAGVEGVVKHISPDGKKLTIWNRKRQADHRVDITKAEKIPGIARRKMAEQGVAEGGILKSIKRGMQGWGTGNAPTPKELVKRNKEYGDDTIKALATDTRKVNKHSPADLQKRVVDREMKKRGLAQEGVAEGSNSSPFDQMANLKSKSNKELDELVSFWQRALEKNPNHKVANDQLHIIKMIRAERIGKKGVAEGYEKKDMTGKTCEKCKKDTYQERSLRDDWEGTLRCSCGHVVDRWRKYKKKDDEQGVAEGQTGKPIKPGRTFRFPNHWNKADVVFEFLRKKNAVVDVEYSYDTKKWTVTDSRPATEKDIKQWSTINGGLPSVNEQGVAEDIASTRREVNLKKKIDKDVATPEQKKEYQELKAKNMGGHALKQSVAVSKDSKKK